MTLNEDGDPTVSKTLKDHCSINKPNHILNVDIIETRMVNKYIMYGIRNLYLYLYLPPTMNVVITEAN